MTSLLPSDQRVNIVLSGESVTVPDGKVWKVTVMTADTSTAFIFTDEDDIGTNDYGEINSTESDTDSTVETTVHEGGAVEATGTAIVTGWQFDYA